MSHEDDTNIHFCEKEIKTQPKHSKIFNGTFNKNGTFNNTLPLVLKRKHHKSSKFKEKKFPFVKSKFKFS